MSLGSFLVLGFLSTWLTPVWLLSLGTLLGLAVLGLCYGGLLATSRRLADVAYTSVREGILLPIFYLAVLLSGFALLAAFLVPGLPYRQLLEAVSRITAVGNKDIVATVPPSTKEFELPL